MKKLKFYNFNYIKQLHAYQKLHNSKEKTITNEFNEHVEQERAEQERLEKERLEQERLEKKRLEQERLALERLTQERLEQERHEILTMVNHSLFNHLRDKEITILEIGLNDDGQCLSLREWAARFPFARIYGIDDNQDMANLVFNDNRVTTHYCNFKPLHSVYDQLNPIMNPFTSRFDIIVNNKEKTDLDINKRDLDLFKYFYSHVKSGGYYIYGPKQDRKIICSLKNVQ